MDVSTAIGVVKYMFMGIFIVFFILDMKSKKSYKIHYYTFLTMAVVLTAIGWKWSQVYKMGFIILFVLLAAKAMIEERKRWAKKEHAEVE